MPPDDRLDPGAAVTGAGSIDRRRAAEIFADVVELDPEQRPAAVDDACGKDDALRAEVESLLAAYPAARQYFTARPNIRVALEASASDPPDPFTGRELGAYRVVRLIAHGGMGSVYLGERVDRTYRKEVAIKLLRPVPGGAELFERFNQERQVLADLEHPGIARLIDGGTTADGVPYLVMEYVDGVPLSEYCATHRLPQTARLRLFLEICGAVSYAHRNLVIHRDLKPGNILVDAGGRTRLLDFGIAKVLQPPRGDIDERPPVTELRVMTPGYASPEHVRGDRITTATDVYSLGVVLFEVLTGVMPYRMNARTPSELERIICQEPPRRPGLDADLDTVILKSLHKEPERRYPGVDDLAEDLRRYLDGLPVRARPDTTSYRVSKFVRRHKSLTGTVLAVLAVLTVSLAVSVNAYRVAKARAVELQWMAYSSALSAAEASILGGNLGEAEQHLDRAPSALRGWEWRHLRVRLDRSARTWTAHRMGITSIAFSPDGTRFVTASLDSTARLWDASTGECLRAWSGFGSGIESCVLDPLGRFVLLGLSTGGIRRCSLSEATCTSLTEGGNWAILSVRDDGARIAAGFLDGRVSVWDAATGVLLRTWPAHRATAVVAYLPGRQRLATAGGDGMLRLWDEARDAPLDEWEAHARRVYALAADPSGERVVTGSIDRTARVWNLTEQRLESEFREHEGTVAALAFSADGARVVSAGADGTVFEWNAASGVQLSQLRGHRADVSAIATAPDGRSVLTGAWDGSFKLWTSSREDVRVLHDTGDRARVVRLDHLALDREGSRVAWIAGERVAFGRLNDTDPARSSELWDVRGIAFVPDGARLIAGTGSGELVVLNTEDGTVTARAKVDDAPVTALTSDATGTRIFVATTRSGVSERSLDGLRQLRILAPAESAGVVELACTASGEVLVAGFSDGTVRAFQTATGQPHSVLKTGRAPLVDLALSGDRFLAAGFEDGSIQIWDLPRRRLLLDLPQRYHDAPIVTWNRDGSRLAVSGAGRIVELVDSKTGRSLVGLHGHVARVTALAFAPEDRCLLSSSFDGTIRVWDAMPVGQ